MSLTAGAADTLVALYQRTLSPRKGFSCAHRVAHGGPSCSAAARDLLRTRGVARAALLMVARFHACYRAAALLMASDVRGVCCCGPIPIPFRF